jgi:hypothetical protein
MLSLVRKFHIPLFLVFWHRIPGQTGSFASARALEMFENESDVSDLEEKGEEMGDEAIQISIASRVNPLKTKRICFI